jgi:hypothetical protein
MELNHSIAYIINACTDLLEVFYRNHVEKKHQKQGAIEQKLDDYFRQAFDLCNTLSRLIRQQQ